jgi:hypothetical protein
VKAGVQGRLVCGGLRVCVDGRLWGKMGEGSFFFFDRGRGGLARLKGEEAENQKPPQSRGFSRFSFSREGGGRSGEREKGRWLLWLL